MQSAEITSSEVRSALENLSSNELFSSLERLKSFLNYIVEEELEGRGEDIRGKTIAQDVYSRDPTEGGDNVNVVRVEARRLRQLLDHYYETVGAPDPVRIHLDTGGYRPRFERVDSPISAEPYNRRKSFALLALMFVSGLLIGVGFSQFYLSGSNNFPQTPVVSGSSRALERQAIFEKSPASLQAVNLAEQARGMIFPIFDRPRQQLVTEVFGRVIELDPDYFGGYAGSAQTIATLAIITPPGDDRSTLILAANQMSKEALRLEPADAWVQSALGWVELANRNYDEAIRLARRSAEIAPDDGNILDFFGSVALFTGYFEEAVASAERGKDMSGSNRRLANRNIFAAASFHLGNYEESLAAFQAAAEFGDPISAPSLAFQAADLNALGRKAEAARIIDELRTAWPEANLRGMLLGVYRDPDHAEEVLAHIEDLGWTPPKRTER